MAADVVAAAGEPVPVAVGVAVGSPPPPGALLLGTPVLWMAVGELEVIGVGGPWADRVGNGVPLDDGEGTAVGTAVGVAVSAADLDGAGTCPPGRVPCGAGWGESAG